MNCMTGPATFLAICEMNRIAEEALPRVRQELFRLDCLSAFVASCQDGCLKITFRDDAVLVDPSELLVLLQGINTKDTNELLWQRIRRTAMIDLGASCPRLNLIAVMVFVVVSVLLTLRFTGAIEF